MVIFWLIVVVILMFVLGRMSLRDIVRSIDQNDTYEPSFGEVLIYIIASIAFWYPKDKR